MQASDFKDPSSEETFSEPLTSSESIPEVEETAGEVCIVDTQHLSEEAKLKLEVLNFLREPCDRKTYGVRLKEAAVRLDASVRTVQRLMRKYEEKGLQAILKTERADRGSYRTDPEWQDFIVKTYKEGNKGSRKMSPAQVHIKVQAEADRRGLTSHPSHMAVYRILNPIIERKKEKQKVRNSGWRGSRLSHKTRDGQTLDVKHSNHVWQCDHTKLDLLLVDHRGELLGRPWLTKITDSYSRCIMGIHLGFDAPSSQVVALALRHAILLKRYSLDFKLHAEWSTYGVPEHLFTDGGRDFRSDHLTKQIAPQLGFECHLRDRPSEGGIEERGFGTINTDFLSGFSGYVGSNIQERSKVAEEEARFTLQELLRLLVRYITDNYNQRIDKRSGQTRLERWQAGLPYMPKLIDERELDVCLMKKTRRTIYRSGYVKFENVDYRGDSLSAFAGESAFLRFNPEDITSVWVYRLEKGKEVYLGAAHAVGLETEQLALAEAKAASKRLRDAGKNINNKSILAEVRDRSKYIQKKGRKERQKEEQKLAYTNTQPTEYSAPELDREEQKMERENAKPSESCSSEADDATMTTTEKPSTASGSRPKIRDLNKLRSDYNW